MDKNTTYLTYANTALIVLLLILNIHPFAVGNVKFGALSTATTYYDVNVDSANGIGSGTYAVNGRVAIASSSNGIAFTASTLNATTSLQAASSTLTGGTTIVNSATIGAVNSVVGTLTGIKCVSQDYNPPSLLAFQTSSVATTLSLAGLSSTISLFATLNTGSSTLIQNLLPQVYSSGTATSAVAQVIFTDINPSSTAAIDEVNGVLTTCAIQK